MWRAQPPQPPFIAVATQLQPRTIHLVINGGAGQGGRGSSLFTTLGSYMARYPELSQGPNVSPAFPMFHPPPWYRRWECQRPGLSNAWCWVGPSCHPPEETLRARKALVAAIQAPKAFRYSVVIRCRYSVVKRYTLHWGNCHRRGFPRLP